MGMRWFYAFKFSLVSCVIYSILLWTELHSRPHLGLRLYPDVSPRCPELRHWIFQHNGEEQAFVPRIPAGVSGLLDGHRIDCSGSQALDLRYQGIRGRDL
ncbi:hypothetical protein BDY19DRAFT_208043 [Irpex rosettiformis]|uniref:Uncharacterized protein n=1 Tax=Irpex rosettiformis TaxID=378272 RepID=A0ACB8U1B3_9APHY|nr:hypothetical protein BDY19DRAFT_208043 [Irpex rosettiformis]